MTIHLVVNGHEDHAEEGITVDRLLAAKEVKMPEMVSVELNGKVLRREEFASTVLREGDRVEFLYFMGGGLGIH